MSFRLLLILLLAVFFSCKKERRDTHIPYVPVNITLYASDPQFFDLNVPGGWVYIQGGSRGLIVHRRTHDEFVTFDRHCTYDVTNPCGQVMVDSTDFAAIDTCCGSVFQLYDGSVSNGPAIYPLAAYPTTFDGNVLRIQN